jgi:hypothetical protein
MTNVASANGAHHIGLMVTDLAKSRSFFVDILGFWQIGEVGDCPAVLLTNGTSTITLWQADKPTMAVATMQRDTDGSTLGDVGPKAFSALHDSLTPTEDANVAIPSEQPSSNWPTGSHST